MSENNSFESSRIMSATEDSGNNESEARIQTQEEVHYQIKNYFPPLTKRLEDLTRLIQGMLSGDQPCFLQVQ